MIIKLFEEFISQELNTIKYNVYVLTEETDDTTDIIYGIWDTIEDAKSEADAHDTDWVRI